MLATSKCIMIIKKILKNWLYLIEWKEFIISTIKTPIVRKTDIDQQIFDNYILSFFKIIYLPLTPKYTQR